MIIVSQKSDYKFQKNSIEWQQKFSSKKEFQKAYNNINQYFIHDFIFFKFTKLRFKI